MKSLLAALSLAVAGVTLSVVPFDADAIRLGGRRPSGMQRQAPAKPVESTPAQPAAPAQPGTPANAAPVAGAAAAATAGKRSWMAPLAGLAAGLGIAALLSHFGMGEGFSNIVMILLLGFAAFFLFRFVMSRFAGPRGSANGGVGGMPSGLRMATASATGAVAAGPLRPIPIPSESRSTPASSWRESSAVEPVAIAGRSAGSGGMAPEGFDAAAFERVAKMIFIRMQAANDAGQVDDLRKFTTPELFASLRVDLQERGAGAQRTDVPQLHAQVIETAQEDGQWLVSVRFTGLISEDTGVPAQPFAERWHLVKPVDGGGEWAIAGITPES